jgi:hypothetical protein
MKYIVYISRLCYSFWPIYFSTMSLQQILQYAVKLQINLRLDIAFRRSYSVETLIRGS